MDTTYYPDELYHYGRKGMKWGQNIFGKRKTNPLKKKTKEYRDSKKTDPKTDFLKINRPNSAALGMNYITGGHYYQGQSATYGSRRAARELKQKK